MFQFLRKKTSVLVSLVALSVCLAFIVISTVLYVQNASLRKTARVDSSGLTEKYNYLNKTKILDLKKHYIIDFSSLKKQLLEVNKKYTAKTYVYFAYLNNGSWVGLNERDEFTAASLVKVPLAMAVFKAIEEQRLSLNDKYTLSDLDLDSNFGELYKIGADQQFTVIELVRIMLEQSDNTARNAVYTIFSKIGVSDPLAEVYGSLGWEILPPITSDGQMVDTNYGAINLKVLSNMFLALYNATYIDIEHSQMVLDYLAHTPFTDKVRAGVPEGVDVAHKIGTAGLESTFSDCGIVYAPNRHYLLCLGVSGASEKNAANFMREVSETVYGFVINN